MNFCPRCGIGQVAEGAAECPICGYELPKERTVAMRVADELEQTVRRELGRFYQVERPLGQGGMSVVYLARELDLNRLVAVKVLPVQLSFDPEAAKRFQREAKIAAGLDHPHIVPIHRVGTTPSLLWYSMKLVDGQSLAEILKAHPRMEVEECVAIVEQVGAALHYAHRRGVVHRDVKPSNVMLDQDGWAWVCDFGVAKAFGAVPLTQTGSTLGTPRYMSPEQCYGGSLDGRADQYSLAMLTYECLAGQPVFTADSIGEYVHKHTSVPPPSLPETRPDLPDTIVDAVARALSKAPEKRFPDVQQFVQALGGQTERRTLNFIMTPRDSQAAVTPVTPPASLARRPAARWRRPAGLGVAAVVVLGSLAAVAPLVLHRKPPQVAAIQHPDTTAAIQHPDTAAAIQHPDTVAARPSPPSPHQVALSPRRVATPKRQVPTGTQSSAPSNAPTPPPNHQVAILLITTSPLGKLYVDDVRRGTSFTAPKGVQLTPGHHVITVELEGYEPFVKEQDVASGDTLRFLGIQLQPKRP